MLNTSIVKNSYLIYRFQSGGSSFYVKANIKWPGGSCEMDRVRIAIPETIGQGLIFSYDGNYSYVGGYTGNYGNSSGGHGGSVMSGGSSSAQPDTQEGPDASETPVRGRGGRRRESCTLYSAPGYKDGRAAAGQTTKEMLEGVTPPQVRGQDEKNRDSDPQIQPADEMEDVAGLLEGESEVTDTEQGPPKEGVQGGKDSGKSGLKWHAGAVLAVTVIGDTVVCLRRRKRK